MPRVALMLVLVCAVGCRASDPAPEIGDVAEDVCAPLAAYICERAAACGCEVITTAGRIDVARCVERFRADCVGRYSWAIAGGAVAERRTTREYLAQLEASSSCDEIESYWFRGTVYFPVEVGEPCTDYSAYCAGGRGLCDGDVCRALPGEGEPCGPSYCAAGLRCDTSTGTCRRPSREGEPCTSRRDCVVGLRCLDDTCRVPVSDGGACSTADECAGGLWCGVRCGPAWRESCDSCASNDFCGERAPRCRARFGEGAPCREQRECAVGLACNGSVANPGECVPSPGVGDLCLWWSEAECAAGSQCSDGYCRTEVGEGELCDGFHVCEPTLACRDGACGPLPGLGEPCFERRCATPLVCGPDDTCSTGAAGTECGRLIEPECGVGFYCDGFHCTPVNETGSGCDTDPAGQCEGACVRDESGAHTCVDAPRAEGDPCERHEDCPIDTFCGSEEACVPGLCRALTYDW